MTEPIRLPEKVARGFLITEKGEEEMITEERIVKVLKNGCPKCKSFNLAVDSTERVRRLVSIHSSTPGSIVWDKAEYIDTVSEDYIICGDCGWQEPEK